MEKNPPFQTIPPLPPPLYSEKKWYYGTNVKAIGFLVCFNWDSLHARLNSYYKAWSYNKRKHKKIKAYRKSVQKELKVKRCLLILDLKPFRL